MVMERLVCWDLGSNYINSPGMIYVVTWCGCGCDLASQPCFVLVPETYIMTLLFGNSTYRTHANARAWGRCMSFFLTSRSVMATAHAWSPCLALCRWIFVIPAAAIYEDNCWFFQFKSLDNMFLFFFFFFFVLRKTRDNVRGRQYIICLLQSVAPPSVYL